MSDLVLKTFNKLYPMMIRKYSDLIIDQNASEKDKINSIILKLNALGKLSNDVVRDWNTVYQWAMNDGLTQDVNNKIEDMLAKGQLKSITDALVAEIGDLTTLTTPQKDTIVHSINSLQSEVTTNTNAISTNTANIATNTSQLSGNANNLNGSFINVLFPPAPQVACKGDLSQDDTTALNNLIAYASSFSPKKKILLPANSKYKIGGVVTFTCDVWGIGEIQIINGGKIVLGTPMKVYNLNVNVMDLNINYDVVRVQSSHVDIFDISISYNSTITSDAQYIALNVEQITGQPFIWDITIHKVYISVCKIGIQAKTTEAITILNIQNFTISGYTDTGIKLDASNGKLLGYCTVKTGVLQNTRQVNTTKTAIHTDGLGTVIDDIKIFNDAPTYGTHNSITASDPTLANYIATNDTINLANYVVADTAGKISNVRAEGIVDLGNLKNLYKLDNIHVYQALGTTHFGGYNNHYDYDKDYSYFDVDLTQVSWDAGAAGNYTKVQSQNYLTITCTTSSTIRFYMTLPQYIIDACNKSGMIVSAVVTDAFRASTYFNIRKSDLTVLSVDQATNIRQDSKLGLNFIPLSISKVLPNGAIVDLMINAIAGQTYKINFMRVYTDLVNPMKDVTPYLANI